MSQTQGPSKVVMRKLGRSLIVASLCALSLFFVRRSLEKDATVRMHEMARALSPLIQQDSAAPRSRTVRINGLAFTVGNQRHSDAVDAILTNVLDTCPGYSAKGGDATYGFAICLQGTLDPRKPTAMVSTMTRWLTTGLLSPSQTLFVLAKRAHDKGSVVLSFENHGGDLEASFAALAADAPSTGVNHKVPGPRHSRRLLSLGEDGQPYDVSVWSSRESVAKVTSDHAAQLRSLGFEIYDLHGGTPRPGHRALVATGADLFAVLSVIDDNQGGTLTAIATSTARSESERLRILTEGAP